MSKYCTICNLIYRNNEVKTCENCGNALLKYTENQHTVPRVYLKGFAKEIRKKKDGETVLINRYNIHKNTEMLFGTKGVACDHEFYELRTDEGNQLLINYLERFFGVLERKFLEKLQILQKKKNKLTKKEKIWWVTYILLQFLRTKYFIETTEDIFRNMFPNDKVNIHTKALLLSIPCGLLPSDKEFFMINAIFSYFQKLDFKVYENKSGEFITSDNPVCVFKSEKNQQKIVEVLFPVTRFIAISLQHKKYIFPDSYSVFDVNSRIAVHARDEIYSSYSLKSMSQNGEELYVTCLKKYYHRISRDHLSFYDEMQKKHKHKNFYNIFCK